jgi:Xaa-Pro dipeptidase
MSGCGRDHAEANPAADLKALAAELGLAGGGSRGVRQLRPHRRQRRRLDAAFEGFAALVDGVAPRGPTAGGEVADELAYVRRAGELADRADAAALALIRWERTRGTARRPACGDLPAGGDYPGNVHHRVRADALLCRYKSGRRVLDARDQITLEFAGSYRHYHAAIMRTAVVGEPRPLHLSYHRAAREALLACEAELKPGRTAGDVFAAHARVLDEHGLSQHRLNACGYSLGAKFTPSWMDPPMFYEANPWRSSAAWWSSPT